MARYSFAICFGAVSNRLVIKQAPFPDGEPHRFGAVSNRLVIKQAVGGNIDPAELSEAVHAAAVAWRVVEIVEG